MPYRYHFDETRAGDLQLPRQEYEILQGAYGLLRDELKAWNDRAIKHGATTPPYEAEVQDLSDMIEWGDKILAKNPHHVIVNGISIGSCSYAKAALMLMIRGRSSELQNNTKQGWPEGVLQSLRESIAKIQKIADKIRYEPNEVLWEVMPRSTETEFESDGVMEWNVFIAHASEDKDFVRTLAQGLKDQGIKVWFDEFTLTVGDSLRRSIDRGLAHSRFGIVVISPQFLDKEWPQKELDGLVARESDGTKTILPVWHHISAKEIRERSPLLADRLATNSNKGLEKVIEDLLRVVLARAPED